MNDRQQILSMLTEVFDRWEELLGGMSDEVISASPLPAAWSIKAVIAHLWAWQQVSIARLEAARLDTEPVFPDWLAGSDPESEEDTDQFIQCPEPLPHGTPYTLLQHSTCGLSLVDRHHADLPSSRVLRLRCRPEERDRGTPLLSVWRPLSLWVRSLPRLLRPVTQD
jgi:hypothetical protein